MKRRLPLFGVVAVFLFIVLGLWALAFDTRARKNNAWTMVAFLVQIGAEKKDVEKQFGKPSHCSTDEGEERCKYTYKINFADWWSIFVTYGKDGKAKYGEAEGKVFRPDDPPVEF